MKTNELMKYIHQKGQALVEFAIILPLFLMMFFTLAYGGAMFSDYLTLTHVARSCAHDAATATVGESSGDDGEKIYSINNISKIRDRAATNKDGFISDAFIWNAYDERYLKIEVDPEDKHSIRVTVNADFDTSNSYLAGLAYRLISLGSGGSVNDVVIPNFYHIEYVMYNEAE